MSGSPPLLLIAHGTRDSLGVQQMLHFADRLDKTVPDFPVFAGFLELSSPPIADAVARLVDAGHSRAVVLPLMLLGGGHGKDDIPAALARERLRHPGLELLYGRQLDLHPVLLSVYADRVAEAAGEGDHDETAVLVVGRGTSDPDANADLHKVARLLWEGRDYQWVETAFSGVTRPLVPEGIARCRRLGARRVIVVPYYLFDGVLVRRMRADAAAAASPGLEVVMGDYMGLDERLFAVVKDRYLEALHGDAKMNCDLCVHRVALPGFENKVGKAAYPHDHPDDPVGHTHGHEHAHTHSASLPLSFPPDPDEVPPHLH